MPLPGAVSARIPPGFIDALVLYADTVGNDADLRSEFDALFVRMQNNAGKETIASTINGKYFGFQVSMATEDKFAAFGEAIRRYNGNSITCTYPNWAGLVR